MKGIKLTKEEVIRQFEKVHKGKYDYSNIEYINQISPIMVKCREHGEFETTPNAHLYIGNICPKCRISDQLSSTIRHINKNLKKCNNRKELFLELVKDRPYDYTKIEYIDKDTPIVIICKEHGNFIEKPSYHLSSNGGCPKCAMVIKGRRFIERAKNKFKARFNYDKFIYTGSTSNGIITCLEHGDFEQTPTLHLASKEPCPICRGIFGNDTETFIIKAKKIYDEEYDYSLVKYYNKKTAVQIICKRHGVFWKTPDTFLNQKQGCPSCNINNQISKNEILWLNSQLVPIRSYKIDNYIVDGFNPITNTIYEYLGDYWHGNLEKYIATDINKINGKTYGELNLKTFERIDKLKSMGYNVIYIWESDYLKGS